MSLVCWSGGRNGHRLQAEETTWGKEKNHTKVYRKCANFGLVERYLVLKNEKQEAGEIKKQVEWRLINNNN